jgi:hypothetical protein
VNSSLQLQLTFLAIPQTFKQSGEIYWPGSALLCALSNKEVVLAPVSRLPTHARQATECESSKARAAPDQSGRQYPHTNATVKTMNRTSASLRKSSPSTMSNSSLKFDVGIHASSLWTATLPACEM